MSEAPRRRETILNLSASEEARTIAAEYITNHPELHDAVLASDNAMEVRKHVWEHFGIPTDLNPDPAPHISQHQQAVLVESVDRWNKQRTAGSQ